VLDGLRILLVPDSGRVQLLDVTAGRWRWTYRLRGETTRSGEPPLVAASTEATIVVEPRNIGCRVQRLDPATGKLLWPNPPLVALDRLEPAAWQVGNDVFYHVDAGRLYLRSLKDGKPAGERLLGAGAWRLARSGRVILAWHDREPAMQFRFRSLTGTLQWQAGPWPAGGTASLTCLDAGTSEPVQRINLEVDRLTTRAWHTPERGGVFPRPTFWRDAEGAAGLAVVHDRNGLLVGLGNRVKALRSDQRSEVRGQKSEKTDQRRR
jgi:hypothetical protein